MVVEIVEGASTRRLDESEFPLALGGPDGLPLPGTEAASALAYLGFADGELFVQPAGAPVRVNGTTVSASHWLSEGDLVRVGSAALVYERRNGTVALTLRGVAEPGGERTPASAPSPPPPVTKVKPIHFEPVSIERLRRKRSGVGFGNFVFWGALGALALAAWYVFSARAVVFEFEPEPARVEIRGALLQVPIGERYLLRPGTYRVVAEREGFRPLDETIEVGDDRSQSFRFALAPLPGRLALATPGAEGAVVSIDGEEVGATPLEPLELEAGEYAVRIRKDRYREFSGTVILAGEGRTEELSVELEPLWAPITFRSEPVGASVSVGGRAIGKTPVTVDLLEGSHAFEIDLPGRKPHRGRVRVVAGEARTVSPSSPLDLADGVLRIASVPPEASVTVNGAYRGATPLDLRLAPDEDHRIELSAAGYDPKTVEVSVGPGKTESLSVELDARLGEVRIAAEPAGAELFVNGQPRGAAQQVLQLPAVPQRIEIRMEGYQEFATDLTPRPGYPQTVEVVLDSLVPKKATLDPVVTTPSGHELRLVQPRRFQMGAPRREPGRRANEVLRDVEITRPFYLGAREVTNRQFRQFKPSHRSGVVHGHSLETDHHPAVNVRWEEAVQYCNWLSAQEGLTPAYVVQGGELVLASPPTNGYRLPTEAEWELAARYAGGEPVKYPWGESLPVAPGSGNFADLTAGGLVATTIPDYNDRFPVTAPVDAFPANALGIRDLGGNVAEWVHDVYAIHPPSVGEGASRDPLGPDEGEFRVIRGSSYLHGSVTQLRHTFRDYGNKARPDVGFRIARWAE